ncbi:amidase family protein, partial [Nocardiopsis lucentensis]
MTQIHELPAHRLADLVRRRELSPREIAEHCLDRIERLDPTYGGFVAVSPEHVLEQARYAEKRVMRDTPDTLPPLLGVPLPIKDLDLLAGSPTTFGSRAVDPVPAPFDDGAVAALRFAGALLLGKTNTPEFGSTCYTENDVAPPSR